MSKADQFQEAAHDARPVKQSRRVESAGEPPERRRVSRFWSVTLRLIYWGITRLQPVLRPWAERGEFGNVVELIVVGRRSGLQRVVLLGLLQVDERWYVGHPNGPVDWTRNLDSAGSATLVLPHQPPVEIRVNVLPIGDERRRVISVTWHQQVFPGNILYWLARHHILAFGRYYRIEPQEPPAPGSGNVMIGQPVLRLIVAAGAGENGLKVSRIQPP